MKLSKSFWITRKDNPSEEESFINKILIKSGYIYKNSSGIYTYLPLGVKLAQNIKNIINEECEKAGAMEVCFPSLVSSSVFEKSERNNLFGKSMFKVIDRNNKEYNLCPTHEELFAELAGARINSYKDLHFVLYQISNKFRDEVKTNKGLVRKKEFSMFDAYSFDTDEAGLDISYDNMYHVFKKIFRRLGLDTVVCESDPGKMYAYYSEEFHVVGTYGENDIAKCSKCSFIANIDIAEVKAEKRYKDKKVEKLNKVFTPGINDINGICNYFNVKEYQVLKSIIYKVNNSYKMIIMCGNDEVNDAKLFRAFGTNNFRAISDEEIRKLGSYPGFVGPMKCTMEIIADNAVKYMSNFICGGNQKDVFYVNVNIPFDFKVGRYMDLKQFTPETKCPKCGSTVEIIKGLEVGNIFKLGGTFSKKIGVTYLNEKNEKNYAIMGSYGIGIDRCIYALAEAYHDDNGLKFPIAIAPYKVAIVIANVNDKDSKKYAEGLYEKLRRENIDVLFDDRKETLGIKLNDMDLVGVPICVIVGKYLNMDKIEFKLRNNDEKQIIDKSEVFDKLIKIIKK